MMEDLAFQNNVDSAVSYCYFFGAYCAAYGIKDSIIVLHTPVAKEEYYTFGPCTIIPTILKLHCLQI